MYSVNPLTAEQVYCFCVLLCDNDVDRDFECFSVSSLKTLAQLYIGRTGIFDHDPKGGNQTARIYRTEVKEYPERKTLAGETYTALMGHAYMVRTEENRSLIAEIDGGIKKEVSVGCAVSSKICSVCGADILKNPCFHIKGRYYDKKLCFATLENPTDAYEWSFVAAPILAPSIAKKFMAKKFIDADLLKEEIERNWDMQDLYLPIHFFDKVDEMPAADVQEVRHGYWENVDNYSNKCSCCGRLFELRFYDYKYCPRCGARMDGDSNA